MSGASQLMLMIAGVHLLGAACVAVLIIAALRSQPYPGSFPDQGTDDGGGNWPRSGPKRPDSPRGGIPLPDADPARVRLRDHGTLADRLPARDRRPAREPDRRPVRI